MSYAPPTALGGRLWRYSGTPSTTGGCTMPTRRDFLLTSASLMAAGSALAQPATPGPAPLPAEQIGEVAINAWIYAYPLILMELTRRISTNVADTSRFGRAPINRFAHMPAFPDPSFSDVVRPNADTLYSALWFDVTREPLLVGVPDSGGRYWLMPLLDLWTGVFASPGKRTTGTGAQLVAIAGPGWQGEVPAGARLIRSPTATGWAVGRTQTNGKADYDAVHRFQAGITATPLSQWGKASAPAAATVNPVGT